MTQLNRQPHTAKARRSAKAREEKLWLGERLRAGSEVARAPPPKNFAPLRKRRAFAVCFCFSLACGYAAVRGQKAQPVRMAAVKNDTAQAEAGGLFAAAFRAELAGRGQLDLDGASSPELLLEVVALRSVPSGTAGEGAASFRLDADLKLEVGSWQIRFGASEDYFAGIDVLGTEANRRAALRRLARAAAREALERYDVAGRLK